MCRKVAKFQPEHSNRMLFSYTKVWTTLSASLLRLTLLLLLVGIGTAKAQQAAPVRVSLLLGDGAAVTTLRAVDQLEQDPQLQGIEFRVFPRIAPSLDARRFLQFSNLVLVNTHDRDFVFSVAEDLAQVQARGGRTLSVSNVFDPDVAALGLRQDRSLVAYFDTGGQANLVNLIRAALSQREVPNLAYADVEPVPESAWYDVSSKRFFTSFDDYSAAYLAARPGREALPWVGLYFNRDSAVSGNDALLESISAALEQRGLNVLAGYGYPGTRAGTLFGDATGKARVGALVALSLKLGNIVADLEPVLRQLDVPILNAISLYDQSLEQFTASRVGLDFAERTWQLGGAELAGAIAPTIVGSKEVLVDAQSGIEIARVMPIAERVERLADRAVALLRLRQLPSADKNVAVIYYNYPPGRENVGASYLNVLSASLWQILSRLVQDGFTASGAPADEATLFTAIRSFGSNPPPEGESSAVVSRLAESGQVQLLPVRRYREWFDQIPASLRDAMVARWGEPEQSEYMVWRDPKGEPYFVFPSQRWGNVLFATQPARTGDRDIAAAYHDLELPPHHQYLAFYLWLQHVFGADAMVHVGTHATHEWLPGKEAGFTEADASEVMVGAVPQLYPYIVDNIGEGLQAKRRGMAAIITHMTPPIDKASLNPELRQVAGLINDIVVGREKGSFAREDMLRELATRSAELGLLTDLSIKLEPEQLLSDAQVDDLEHHIKKIGEKLTPFGLHTFGVAPDPAMQERTAEAVLSLEPELDADTFARRKQELVQRIQQSARDELDALSAGLAGRMVPAGPGNDPVRNPDALPTGRNFYGFDPARLPTLGSYEAGTRLAKDFIDGYRSRHDGVYPDRVVFNLFATETNRHEGSMEAQILQLMGVRPVWDPRGRVNGVELIPTEELGRPRVDVTVVPSGLYRDQFPVLMQLLDDAVSLVREAAADGNPLRSNVDAMLATLMQQGLDADAARRIASVRVFTEPTGVYGTGLETVIQADQSWEEESELSDVYFRRVGHLFGQGFWGDVDTEGSLEPQLAEAVFKAALSGAKAVVHSRSSNIYATLDNDDFYQYLGGTAMAIRQIDGSTPETLVADLTDPRGGMTVSLERFMGEEIRARYLNPKWIEEMLDEGYAGARFVRQVVDNLWGWQVTNPEVVDDSKWQEFFETYVEDRYELDIEQRFRAAENLGAYEALMERMLVAVEKGYWDAADETVQALKETLARIAPEVQADEARIATMMAAPGPSVASMPVTPAASVSPAAAAAASAPQVVGRVLEESTAAKPSATVEPWRALLQLAAGVVLLAGLFGLGWWRQARIH